MKAQDIKKGMKTQWWVALEDAKIEKTPTKGRYPAGDVVVIRVEHLDGEQESRMWDADANVPIV